MNNNSISADLAATASPQSCGEMTPIEALVKRADSNTYSIPFEGGFLWSNGWILIRGDYPAKKAMPSMADVWAKNSIRDEVEAQLGICVEGYRGRVYRALVSDGCPVWIDEAFRQALQFDGCTVHVKGPRDAIVFRAGGVVVGIAMPVNYADLAPTPINPTDELVWGNYANESNGFFRQDRRALLSKWNSRMSEVRRELRQLQGRIDECQSELSDLSIKIDALKRLEAADNATPSQVGLEGTTPQGPPA